VDWRKRWLEQGAAEEMVGVEGVHDGNCVTAACQGAGQALDKYAVTAKIEGRIEGRKHAYTQRPIRH
jgi:hypothetical protein